MFGDGSQEKKELMKTRKIMLMFCAVFVISTFFTEGLSGAQNEDPDHSLRKGENRQTLDPTLFSDPQVREAYTVARKIPWILDSIYCYCRCKESRVFRHKSLLSCYVDDHASQ